MVYRFLERRTSILRGLRPGLSFSELHGSAMTCPVKFGMKLLIHSQTSYTHWFSTCSQTHDIIMTSFLRQNDVATSFWRDNDTVYCVWWEAIKLFWILKSLILNDDIITPFVRWDSITDGIDEYGRKQHWIMNGEQLTYDASFHDDVIKWKLFSRYWPFVRGIPWWRHQMETFSALLAICAGNSPVPGEFPTQRPVTRSFDVFFDLRLNKWLSKQRRGWWFETISRPLRRHRNAPVTDEFPSLRAPGTRSFDVFFDLNDRLCKQLRRRCFETPSCSLWRHCNVVLLFKSFTFVELSLARYGTKNVSRVSFDYCITLKWWMKFQSTLSKIH